LEDLFRFVMVRPAELSKEVTPLGLDETTPLAEDLRGAL
jgi:hypothetical protein